MHLESNRDASKIILSGDSIRKLYRWNAKILDVRLPEQLADYLRSWMDCRCVSTRLQASAWSRQTELNPRYVSHLVHPTLPPSSITAMAYQAQSGLARTLSPPFPIKSKQYVLSILSCTASHASALSYTIPLGSFSSLAFPGMQSGLTDSFTLLFWSK